MQARWMDNSTGRFISIDPIQDGYNWYAYCEGNPVTYTDPTGLETLEDAYLSGKKTTDSNYKDNSSSMSDDEFMKSQGVIVAHYKSYGYTINRDGNGNVTSYHYWLGDEFTNEGGEGTKGGPTLSMTLEERRQLYSQSEVRRQENANYNLTWDPTPANKDIVLAPEKKEPVIGPAWNDYGQRAAQADKDAEKKRLLAKNYRESSNYFRAVTGTGEPVEYTTTVTEKYLETERQHKENNVKEWVTDNGKVRWGNVSLKMICGFVLIAGESTPAVMAISRLIRDDEKEKSKTDIYTKADGAAELLRGNTRAFMASYSPEETGEIIFYVVEAAMTGGIGSLKDDAGKAAGKAVANSLDDADDVVKYFRVQGGNWHY